MKQRDSIFTTHVFTVTVPTFGTPFGIMPLGDQHLSSSSHDSGRYADVLRSLRKGGANQYFLFLGDEHDFASTSERRAIEAANLHDTTLDDMDARALEKCYAFARQHEFMAGRIIGMVQGNHYWVFQTEDKEHDVRPGLTSTQWIADKLKTQWLGFLSYVRVAVRVESHPAKSMSVDIVACHGKAGGKLAGTTVNQVDDLRRIFPGADMYIMGHDHKRGGWPESSLYAAEKTGKKHGIRIKQRRQWLVRSGSFAKAYEENTQSYAVGRLLRPAELGVVRIEVKITRRNTGDGSDVAEPDIHIWS